MAGTMSVWYKIGHAEFPQCHTPMLFVSDLRERDAERVARNLYNELRFILGDDCKALVWAE